MNIPILGRAIDERFLDHRLRSTSIAGIIGGVVAMTLFGWRYYVNDIWSWDLLAVGITIAVVKMAAMAWYLFND